MTFQSILVHETNNNLVRETPEAPDFFVDLNLDQVVAAITAGKEEYDLKPLFYTLLHDIGSIEYRHEVMRDLENETLFGYIQSFARQLRIMREHLAQSNKLHYKYQRESWFLDAVEIYCNAITCLVNDLSHAEVRSRGFRDFREYVMSYAGSEPFLSLVEETKALKAALSAVRYCLHINDNRISVRKYESEIDYSEEIEKTFGKFKQGAVRDYTVEFPTWPDMNHVEARVLDLVAMLYPDVFLELDEFCAKHRDYLDTVIGVFDREVQFYIAYLEYIAMFKRAGLKFCYPRVSDRDKEIYNYDGFDVALAGNLLVEGLPVICNDFYLKGAERIFVVSGPNQGGKTTFARTFGQLHYLASIGCPVPGREARLFLFDRLFTHFEKEEDIQNLRGKLQDDLIRIRQILEQATPNSIIIMNEIFTSTTLQDAILLGQKVLEKIVELDLLCVCVTFIDEWASLSEKTVSMVSTVDAENPAVRTYKILRRPADGLSYAISIAEKYRLTYARLKERITS